MEQKINKNGRKLEHFLKMEQKTKNVTKSKQKM